MFYFDNAATTFPKPEPVYVAVDRFSRTCAANPGRGSHEMALAASGVVDDTRETLARFFNSGDPLRVIFTSNATDEINLALHGFLQPGDHVVTSALEHNAVIRPLSALRACGVTTTRVPCTADGSIDPNAVLASIEDNTRLVVITHASNVTGTIMPVEEIGQRVRSCGGFFIVDAAQSAGVLPIDVQAMKIDLLAFAGHKGLLGPQGTGGLIVGERVKLRPHKQGGTGTHSMMEEQPDELPEALESGTLNGPGIAGLGAGARFILDETIGRIHSREVHILKRMLDGLGSVPGVHIHGPCDPTRQVAVVSITVNGWEPVDFGVALDQEFDIAVRTGLHCAPGAHRTIGTFPTGTIRLSPGYFTTDEEVDLVISAVEKLSSRRAATRQIHQYTGSNQ